MEVSPKEIKEALEKTYRPLYSLFLPYRVLYLITASRDGDSNITLISFAKYWKGKVIIPNIALLKSRENIKENNRVVLVAPMLYEYRVKGGMFRKILDRLSYSMVSLPFSKLGRLKVRAFLTFSFVLKYLFPPSKYVLSPAREPKIYIIDGVCELKSDGEEFENMEKLIKLVMPEGFKLREVLVIEPHEINVEKPW